MFHKEAHCRYCKKTVTYKTQKELNELAIQHAFGICLEEKQDRMKEIHVSSIQDILDNHRCSKCGDVLPGIYTFKEESEPIVLDNWFVIKKTKFMLPIAQIGPCDCEVREEEKS